MRKVLSVMVLSLFVVGAYATDVYDNEADFLAAIDTTEFLLEDFGGINGLIDPPYPLGPENGYSGAISDAGPGDLGLWGCSGALSTNSALNLLEVDFSGSPSEVYSSGGFFYGTDINCGFIAGSTVVIGLSDGTVYDFVPTSTTDFRGFVADEPLTWMTIDAPDPVFNVWAVMDHYYIDSPEPGSLALLALGALAVLRRR
jgi:hypothetical protein